MPFACKHAVSPCVAAAKKGYDDVAKMIKQAVKDKREEEGDSDSV